MVRRSNKESNWLKKSYLYLEAVKLLREEKSWCPCFSLNLTCSDLDAARLSEYLPEVRTVVVPNGVDLDYFKKSGVVPEKEFSIVFAGGLSWYPNLDAMVFFLKEVWPALEAKFEGVRFNLVGRNPPPWLQKPSIIS